RSNDDSIVERTGKEPCSQRRTKIIVGIPARSVYDDERAHYRGIPLRQWIVSIDHGTRRPSAQHNPLCTSGSSRRTGGGVGSAHTEERGGKAAYEQTDNRRILHQTLPGHEVRL